MWALHAMSHESALVELRKILHANEPDLVALACRALGLRRDRKSVPELSRLLGHEAAHVGMAAAEALARSGSTARVAALENALSGETDRFFEHALIHALYQLAGDGDLKRALGHRHPRVRKAALLILDQPPRESLPYKAVMARITAPDAELRRTALEILLGHPEWAEHAVDVIEAWVEKPNLTREEAAGLEGLVVAFHAHPKVVKLVREFLADADSVIFEGTRARLLTAIASGNIESVPGAWIEAIARGGGPSGRRPAGTSSRSRVAEDRRTSE